MREKAAAIPIIVYTANLNIRLLGAAVVATFRLNSEIRESYRLPCVCMTFEIVVSRRWLKMAKELMLQPQSKHIPAYLGLEEVWESGHFLGIEGKTKVCGFQFFAFFLVASWPLHRWKGGFFADCQWDAFEIEDVTWKTLMVNIKMMNDSNDVYMNRRVVTNHLKTTSMRSKASNLNISACQKPAQLTTLIADIHWSTLARYCV